MKTKQEYREYLLRSRIEMTQEKVREYSDRITQRLLGLHEIANAKTFFVYVSKDNEVRTHDLIGILMEEGKTVTVPKITCKGIIAPCKIEGFHQLTPGKHRILEPVTEPCKGEIDISIIPAVGLSEDLERLGIGGGYYDRFLEENLETLAIALAYDYQVLPKISTKSHDQPVDMIVTEKRIIF